MVFLNIVFLLQIPQCYMTLLSQSSSHEILLRHNSLSSCMMLSQKHINDFLFIIDGGRRRICYFVFLMVTAIHIRYIRNMHDKKLLSAVEFV